MSKIFTDENGNRYEADEYYSSTHKGCFLITKPALEVQKEWKVTAYSLEDFDEGEGGEQSIDIFWHNKEQAEALRGAVEALMVDITYTGDDEHTTNNKLMITMDNTRKVFGSSDE